MKKKLEWFFVLLLLGVISVVGYRLAVSKVELDIYRDRMNALVNDYESLRSKYNEAVAKTAVTELLVSDNHLQVTIRTIQGVERVIDTPYDPSREIFCDYVLLDGRMWIRRIYDSETPPTKALLIDDTLKTIDWNSRAAPYGQAVYRSLDEGRWIVTVTGDGSLGLAKVPAGTKVVLSGPPPVRDYDQLEREIDDSVGDVRTMDVLKRLVKP